MCLNGFPFFPDSVICGNAIVCRIMEFVEIQNVGISGVLFYPETCYF